MFWWITHGIAKSDMPSFEQSLTEQDRWDVINFLRAFSQGFEARLLSQTIVSLRPWLGAPNFYFEDEDGASRELKDFRDVNSVLLVFPGPVRADNVPRLQQLIQSRDQLQGAGLKVLEISGTMNMLPAGSGVIQIRDGAEEITEVYELLSRSVTNRGDGRTIGMDRQHMEFLLDRFGYIRARWIPEEEADGWNDIARLTRQAVELSTEPRVRPPPDNHVH